MQRNNRNRRSKKSKKTASKSPVLKIERMEHPPQIQTYQVSHSARMRFTATAAAASTVITFQNLLDAILVATTAIAGHDLFDLVKVRCLEVWSQAALGTPSTATVAFETASGDLAIHSDTSLGIKPAYVIAVPSKKSLASFWTGTAGGTCFLITCPAGSVIDVHLSYRTSNFAPALTQNALVGAVIAEIYWRGLDGLAAAGTNFPPPAGILTI